MDGSCTVQIFLSRKLSVLEVSWTFSYQTSNLKLELANMLVENFAVVICDWLILICNTQTTANIGNISKESIMLILSFVKSQ